MKKILLFGIILFTTITIQAQPPQGRGGGRPGGAPPEGMRQRPADTNDQIVLEFFPEIPDLKIEQREKVGSILTQEWKDVAKQMKQKREIEFGNKENKSEKEIEKDRQKIEKIDKKIASIKEKSNKKVRKELTEEQYQVFIEKRNDFRFRSQRGNRPRPDSREGRQRAPQPEEGEGWDRMME